MSERTMDTRHVPFRPYCFIPRNIDVQQRPDGSMLIRSRVPLRDSDPHLPAMLARQAVATPDRMWLAQRRGPDRQWCRLTYGEAKHQVDAVTQMLLNLQRPGRSVVVLSGNSLEHAIVQLAAMQAGMPYAPLTPAYSLMTTNLSTLQAMIDVLKPAVVFAQNGHLFERAIRGLQLPEDAQKVCVEDLVDGLEIHAWSDWIQTPVTPAVAAAVADIKPETVAKYLFTSGSTGQAKAVIITHHMLSLGVAMHEQMETSLPDDPPRQFLDWLPWSHVAGGSISFGLTLSGGGSTWLDDGKPVPGLFNETLKNLRDVSPTQFGSVPIGYTMLVEALERDPSLAVCFFRNLRRISYAGAKLPDSIFTRMQALAVRTTGLRIPFTSAFGSTETSACVTMSHWATEFAGCIGLPHPSVELKLLPLDEGRYELRVRSPAVTPGYLGRPEATKAAFDEEGFFLMGDAVQFADPERIEEGLVFAGRVSEEFKLQSGIFVRVGALRIEAIESARGLLSDVVIAGADQAYIALLAWPNLNACRQHAGTPDATAAELVGSVWLRDAVRDAFRAHNAMEGGSSRRIHRVLLLANPPDIGVGEITDKGYINQRRVLTHRAAEVARLFAEPPDVEVIEID